MSILLPVLFILLLIIAAVGMISRGQKKQDMLYTPPPKKRKFGWFGRKRRVMAEQFKEWVVSNEMLDSEVQDWVKGLSKKEYRLLFDLMEGYCSSLDMEVEWLFSPQLEKASVLHQMLVGAVTSYCTILYMSAQLNKDARAFQAYVALEDQPFHKSSQALAQDLYNSLIEQGLTQTPSVQIMMKGKRARQQHIVTSIQKALEEHPELLMLSLRNVVEGKPATA